MKELWNGVLLVDMVTAEMNFSESPGVLWMEVAVLIMAGLMVMFAVFAILFIYRQKKKDEQLSKEEERKEDV